MVILTHPHSQLHPRRLQDVIANGHPAFLASSSAASASWHRLDKYFVALVSIAGLANTKLIRKVDRVIVAFIFLDVSFFADKRLSKECAL